MNVYLLYRKDWHFVDGECATVQNVYASLEQAQKERDIMNANEHRGDEYGGVYFEVEEEVVL